MNVSVEMITDVCVTCGVLYSLPKLLDDARERDGNDVFCPNGHAQACQSEAERLEEMTVRCDKYAEDNQRLKDDLARVAQKLEQAEAALQAKSPKRGRPRKQHVAKPTK